MKKGGNLVLTAIISLIIAGVAITIPFAVNASNAGKISFKIASAKKISLTINSICSHSFELEFNQKVDLNNFILDISEGKVRIYDKATVSLNNDIITGRDPNPGSYPYVCSDEINAKLDSPDTITYEKTKGRILVY